MEQKFVYVDANYLKELEETAKKVDYYKGIIDGINMVIDRKTESNSEKPNNCEHITEDGVTCAKYPACDDCLDNPLNKVKGSERFVKGKDEPQTYKINPKEPTNMPKCFDCEDFFTCDGQCEIECEKCKHFREEADTYTKQCEFYFMECRYEPKDEPQTERGRVMDLYEAVETICKDYCKYPDIESGNKLADICDKCPMNKCEDLRWAEQTKPKTQTETQNSNLTFKTLEYCDICDHKGCEECIANALDEHCMPSQFKKQIEDECVKEYEELGLKELKELIKADRKTENSSEIPNNCEPQTERSK